MGTINFFGLNGAGSGGGSSTVITSNGISGDGSAGSPIILGGSDIDQDTNFIIDGVEVSFQDTSDPTNHFFIDFGGVNPFLLRLSDTVGLTQTELKLLPANLHLLYTDSATGFIKQIAFTNSVNSGIVVTDTVDNIGLLGAASFPLNGAPEQYLQATTNLNGNALNVTDTHVNIQTDNTLQSISYENPGVTQAIALQNVSSFQHHVIDEVTNDQASVDLSDPKTILLQIFEGGSGNVKEIDILNLASSGVRVADSIDNIGLTGLTLFPLNGDPKQYIQAGNVQSVINVAAQDTAGQTTNQIIPPAYTPLVDSIIRVNAYAFYVAGTGTTDVIIAYTDRLGGVQSVLLGTIGIGSPVTAFPATVLKVKGGTTVSVSFSVTGTITYDAGATIENLFA